MNYEPSSWDPPGPREDPAAGFRTYPDGQGDEAGPKRRLRPESFADHYSQARQFLVSQSEIEQQHIIDTFVFELSKSPLTPDHPFRLRAARAATAPAPAAAIPASRA